MIWYTNRCNVCIYTNEQTNQQTNERINEWMRWYRLADGQTFNLRCLWFLTYKGFSQMYRCGLWQLSSFQLPLGWNSRQFSSPAELLVKKWLCDIAGDTTDPSFIHFHTPSILRSFAPIQKSAEDIYKLMWSHARSTKLCGPRSTSGEFKRNPSTRSVNWHCVFIQTHSCTTQFRQTRKL